MPIALAAVKQTWAGVKRDGRSHGNFTQEHQNGGCLGCDGFGPKVRACCGRLTFDETSYPAYF
jgi:hypothetical protein